MARVPEGPSAAGPPGLPLGTMALARWPRPARPTASSQPFANGHRFRSGAHPSAPAHNPVQTLRCSGGLAPTPQPSGPPPVRPGPDRSRDTGFPETPVGAVDAPGRSARGAGRLRDRTRGGADPPRAAALGVGLSPLRSAARGRPGAWGAGKSEQVPRAAPGPRTPQRHPPGCPSASPRGLRTASRPAERHGG